MNFKSLSIKFLLLFAVFALGALSARGIENLTFRIIFVTVWFIFFGIIFVIIIVAVIYYFAKGRKKEMKKKV